MKTKIEYIQRSIRIPKELYNKAKEEARKDTRSFNNFVALALKERIEIHKKENENVYENL